MKNHYVYKLVELQTGEFYFGSRSCDCEAIEDVKYLGSPKTWKPIKMNLQKIIIREHFKSRKEAVEFEAELIKEVIHDKKNRNYHIPNVGFCTNGYVTCYDTETDKHINIPIEEFETTKERYIPNAKIYGKGNKNSQYGTTFVNNGVSELKIKVGDTIPEGHSAGRLKYIWIHDPNNFKNTRIIEGSLIPDGYVLGKYVRTEVRDKLSTLFKGKQLNVKFNQPKRKPQKSKTYDLEFGRKMAIIHTGKVLSEDHKNKIAASMKDSWNRRKNK